MTPEEEVLAKDIYAALMDHSRRSHRSQQAAEFRFGISDIGYCQERSRRMLDQQVPEDTDLLAAFIGTAIGDLAESALQAQLWPNAIKQAEVKLRLAGETRSYELPGHPDLILPEWGVWDAKTDYGLSTVEREGPSFSQRFQRHAYALAAWEEGYFPGLELDEVMVGNFWIDRGGVDKRVAVHTEPFDADVIQEGIEWLDSVVYAYLQGEEARKEPPREVCRATCGFFKVCRQWDSDVSGLITDPVALGSVQMYAEGHALEKQGTRMKDEAKEHLRDISGSTGTHSLRWIWINPTEVPAKPASTRKGYYKIELRELK